MPIIDFHLHAPHYRNSPQAVYDYIRHYQGGDPEKVIQHFSSPQNMLAYLDENGVDYAVVLGEQSPITTGIFTNEDVAAYCSASPRLIPFANINPHLTTFPGRELERWVKEEGFRGLKLYPPYHYFYPNDAMIYPLYAKAQELGIPVMVHTGSSIFPGSRLKYADPLYLDDVAVDFPDLNLLITHGGRPLWYDQAAFLARLHRNVYIEIGGLPPKKLMEYFPELERIVHKVVFGSDWPGVITIKENIEAVRQLPLSEEAKAMILGGTAARLLKMGD